MTNPCMEERRDWRPMMVAWEKWKGGGYSIHDEQIVEGLCIVLDEKPIVVDGQPLDTCSVIREVFEIAFKHRASFRSAKGAIAYATRVIDNARTDGRRPSAKSQGTAHIRRPRTQDDERRELGRAGENACKRRPPTF